MEMEMDGHLTPPASHVRNCIHHMFSSAPLFPFSPSSRRRPLSDFTTTRADCLPRLAVQLTHGNGRTVFRLPECWTDGVRRARACAQLFPMQFPSVSGGRKRLLLIAESEGQKPLFGAIFEAGKKVSPSSPPPLKPLHSKCPWRRRPEHSNLI